MGAQLAVSSFGGGIVLEGSSDAQRTDELRACDSYDIGDRGQLVVASERTSAFDATDGATHPFTLIYGIEAAQIPQGSFLITLGDYSGSTYIGTVNVNGSTPAATSIVATLVGGIIASFAQFPYVGADNKQKRVILINLGARSGQNPHQAAGLYALVYDPAGPSYAIHPISDYDALGTGPDGEFLGGTQSKQLRPRGVIAYNSHAFLWGFDANDSAGAGNQDGPNRLMFSNIGNPLKYGNDPAPPPAVEADRAFEDSDAFTVGGGGTIIRAACVWNGRLWLGANRGLHYVEGYGRESFKTNGALPIMDSLNVIGPHCLIEGPDRLLHGICDDGHFVFNGSQTDRKFVRLRNYDQQSPGYWDLIWSDPAQATGYPGKTNQDLVWMLSVPVLNQVWIVIPYCDAVAGYGSGGDTVIIKYHCDSGGYTRQVLRNTLLTHGTMYNRDNSSERRTFLASPGASRSISYYGLRSTLNTSPPLPTQLPDVTFGEYAPHGPDGVGVVRKLYQTLSWVTGALPLVFTITPTVDGKALTAFVFTIAASAPGSPSHGDYWLDTSGTDTNLGNGTAGVFTPSSPADYLLKMWHSTWAKWVYVPAGGEQGTRVTVPLAHDIKRGSRVMYRVQATTVTGRYQLEGIGISPATIRSAR